MTMTSRQRILTCFEHRQPDRVPTFIWIDRSSTEQLVSYLGVESEQQAYRRLGIDDWRNVGARLNVPPEHQQRIYDAVPEQFKDDPLYKISPSGRVVRQHEAPHYLDDVAWLPLAGAEEPEELDWYPLPRPEWIEPPQDLPDQIAAFQAEGALVIGHLIQPFKAAWLLRGMDNVLMDYLIRPALLERLYDVIYEVEAEKGALLARAGVDLIQITGDLAMQDRLLMSPDAWRRLDRPRLKKLIARIKDAAPRVKVMMHSDGDVRAIVPDLIECGLDALNPIQPECMDPFEFKRSYGDRLVMHGCVSLQRTLPFGSPQEVKEEVWRLIEGCGTDGGLCLGPSNVIFKEIPPQNVAAMYEAVAEYPGGG